MHPKTKSNFFTPAPVLTVKNFIDEFERWLRFGVHKGVLKYTSNEPGTRTGTEINPLGSARYLTRIFRNELKRDGQDIGMITGLKEGIKDEYSEGRKISAVLPTSRVKFNKKLLPILNRLKYEFEIRGLAKAWREHEPISRGEFYQNIVALYCFELSRRKIVAPSKREELVRKVQAYPN